MTGDLTSERVDPNLPAPPVVAEAPQADYLEMDIRLARIDGQPRSSWIVEPADGRLPYSDAEKTRRAAEAKAKERFDNIEDRDTQERCLTAIGSPEGPPMMNTGFNGHYQIIQTRDYVAIQVEMNMTCGSFAWRAAPTCRPPSSRGSATPWAGGRATPWSSRPPT